MKVLFLYPNKVMVTRMPLGICYLSAHLKREGHEVKIFDTTFIKCSNIEGGDDKLREASLQVKNPNLKKYGLVERDANVFEEFEKEIQSFKPHIVAMSAVDPNYNFGLQFLRLVKEKFPEIINVVGGPIPTFVPEEAILEQCVDIIGVGECEEAMSELCNRMESGEDISKINNIWVKKGKEVYRNEIRPFQNYDDILPPDLDIFDQRHFLRPLGGKMYRMATVIWTRGCAFHCTYCANSAYINIYKNNGKFYRIKKPELLIEELVYQKEKYDLKFFFFVDDIFPLHMPEINERFCELYKKKVAVPFSINLQPMLALKRKEQFLKVVDAGCCNVCIGLESGSENIRKNVLGRHYKDEQLVEIFDLAHKCGIRSSSFNMIGLPHETREDIFKTIGLNRRAKPTSATLTFFHPYRGTGLRDLCIREGLLDFAKEKEDENVYRAESRLSLPQISKEELQGLFKTFQLYFKLPKEYFELIRIAEGDDQIAQEVYSKILKPKFDEATKNEAVWDFSIKKK
jgi:radical SAM superfamily enzyme YgiQ (UPF0313 family)